ncbi:PucR family transcriptional regulator [Microbacterium sp. 22303]|uniref:PucR family transcriptional regulator n=1 Tax=Microbacterium sp. 22303 TaxID=3453905 RepID=UPI003F82FDA4
MPIASESLTIADLVAMPNLGLRLVAGSSGATNEVLWTHTSELQDPGPWFEGGELLVVNGLGIPRDGRSQVQYVTRLADHRLAGIAISVLGPELTTEMLAAADRLDFPILRIPQRIPFIEFSHLVANSSERAARGRLSRHLRILETLRLRNSLESDPVQIYTQLEQASGYRLSLISPAGRPLLRAWPSVPDDVELQQSAQGADLQVIPNGYMLPLFVGDRVTAYLVGVENPETEPGGLAALQHVSSLAVLDAIDDQRRREALHREGGLLLSQAFDEDREESRLDDRFSAAGLSLFNGVRILAIEAAHTSAVDEIEIRDWLADRGLPHLILQRDALYVAVNCGLGQLDSLAVGCGVRIGVSTEARTISELGHNRRQAKWSLRLARESPGTGVTVAEQQFGLARWLNPDSESLEQLASGILHPLVQYDAQNGADLLGTLRVYFRNQGRLRSTAAQLFVHEHTLAYRLKRIEQITGRDLKSYRDAFELWLAVESGPFAS